jgi:copper chaperone CopZ
MMTVMQLYVIGEEKMHGAGCETRVSSALRRLPGVRDVWASSAETQQMAVTIDPSAVSREPMCARLQQLGYEVTP